ncbi:hypothetical protein [Phaeobacter italicus]|jgi:hypothetical protein|uniref:Uncharacterized protein n=1 Tax=Phaeobacter italicus TaxID=481446 RepID=A0A0H5D390_9RHOB|nr:hypothetical protein [Phaeobacter italicus]EEB72465.1 hypothetical protein RR11_3228 [Ruegeria sp. R11]MEC8575465.1 hypothetical protein [Pseudomonadota bacterium]MBO9442901.1 hypothetical protein [Phaeobacter italicus]MBY5975089.1 hypothetical protein [Phaeobacter italicus]MCA0856776.1 hypothetical protein [Phaeobacter italicus]
MSAPDTNVEREEKRHKPALLGIRGVVVAVLVMFAIFLLWVFNKGGEQDAVAPLDVPAQAEVSTIGS